MSTKSAINKSTMQKVYTLHKKGLDEKVCAEVVEASPHTAMRIIKIMSLAEKGDLDGLNEAFGVGNYIRQKGLAKEMFGLYKKEEPTEEASEEVKEQLKLSNYESLALSYQSHITLMCEYLSSINILLEKMAKELGCEGER